MYPSRREGGERDRPPHEGGGESYGGRGAGGWGGGGGGSEWMDRWVTFKDSQADALSYILFVVEDNNGKQLS